MDESFGAGHAMLSFAQVLAGDIDAAEDAARTALRIQPGDAFSQFVVGMQKLMANNATQGTENFLEAIRLDPLEPRMPYLNLLGLAYYGTGDYDNAISTIELNYEKGGPPRPPHGSLRRRVARPTGADATGAGAGAGNAGALSRVSLPALADPLDRRFGTTGRDHSAT